jgi:hypothetical protein
MAWRPRFEVAVVCAVIGALSSSVAVLAQKVVVDATPSHVANAFSPIRALGAGVDRLRAGEGAPEMDRGITKEEVEQNTDKLLSGPLLKAILGAGWQPVTYRQNTELQIEAWHWNRTVLGAIRTNRPATSPAVQIRLRESITHGLTRCRIGATRRVTATGGLV